jgi:tetratricopeptide repeat protein
MPYNRGNAYFDGQQYERAIGDFSRAIELDGSFALLPTSPEDFCASLFFRQPGHPEIRDKMIGIAWKFECGS